MGDIQKNKERYLQLLRSVHRDGIEALCDYLENKTDFFTAPASTKYHGNFEGGLCEHSLDVYDNLVKINKEFGNASDESLIVVALVHDISKTNYYESFDKNIKVDGQWVQEKAYRIREDKLVFGSHEENSLFIAQQFLPLSIEEQTAILHHHSGMSFDGVDPNVISPIYTKYHLAMHLHLADMIAAFQQV